MKKKVMIIPVVYKLAHGVKTVLNNGPNKKSAVEFFLAMCLLFFRTSLCEHVYRRNEIGSKHINCLETNSCFKIFALLPLVLLTEFLLVSKSIVYTSWTLVYSFIFHI